MPPADQTEHELRREWPEYQKPLIAKDLKERFAIDDLKRASRSDKYLARLLQILGLN